MKLREISSTDDIRYSWTDGGFHRKFSHNDKDYEASLLPFAECGSKCIIIRTDNCIDASVVTASLDEREVFRKTYQTFKEENINDSIRDFIMNFAV